MAGLLLVLTASCALCATGERPIVLPKADVLPLALGDDFAFRKSKLYYLDEKPVNGAGQDASIAFERQYRMYGAVTNLDQRSRFGNYFDFFWFSRKTANLKVRLEYRQEKLRSFVQAREVSYANVRGNHRTEFAIIGDDYFNDGRVIAWRVLLVQNGRIVALARSYLWE